MFQEPVVNSEPFDTVFCKTISYYLLLTTCDLLDQNDITDMRVIILCGMQFGFSKKGLFVPSVTVVSKYAPQSSRKT